MQVDSNNDGIGDMCSKNVSVVGGILAKRICATTELVERLKKQSEVLLGYSRIQ